MYSFKNKNKSGEKVMATKIVDVRKGMDEKLSMPSTTKTFHVEYKDPENGRVYGGEFTVKRLNMGDIRQVAIKKAQLNGGVKEENLDTSIRFINAMLAHLEFALIKFPDWWQPDTFYSADVISDIYEEVISFETSFREPVQKQPEIIEKVIQAETESKRSFINPLVDQKVQTTTNLG
jgi:hypothetical protein